MDMRGFTGDYIGDYIMKVTLAMFALTAAMCMAVYYGG